MILFRNVSLSPKKFKNLLGSHRFSQEKRQFSLDVNKNTFSRKIEEKIAKVSSSNCSSGKYKHSTTKTVTAAAATKTTTGVFPKCAHCFFCVTCCEMDLSWQPVTRAAQRRRGRRLRAAWQHEQQPIAQALATFTHHSSRGQRTARAGEWGSELNYTVTIQKTPHSPGGRHPVLCHGRG